MLDNFPWRVLWWTRIAAGDSGFAAASASKAAMAGTNTFYTGEIRALVLGFFLPAIIFHASAPFVSTRRS
jgi:hypothetical protein